MLSLKAFAKLNLYLKVLKKRPDNYHNLITLFERISLYDEIFIKERKDGIINISSNSSEIKFSPQNLIYKTVEILKKELKIKQGVDIYIKKNIPIASGLGGGSSNAACVLEGLNKIWKLRLTLKQLLSYAKGLGADITFFLYNTSFALGKQRGDLIQPLDIKNSLWHLLILPHLKILSKDIYLQLDFFADEFPELTKSSADVKMLIKGLRQKDISLIEQNIYNQLEPVAFRKYPLLKEIKNTLRNKGIKNIFMSGSGPAMFGIFSSRKEAGCLSKLLAKSKAFRAICVHTF